MLQNIVKDLGHFVTRNSTTILTALSVAGVVSTTVLAVRATPVALRELEWQEVQKGRHLEPLEIIKCTYKAYIPAAAMGVLTVSCIIGAHTIGSRKNAALVTAYTLADRASREYQHKVIEMFGEKKEKEVRTAVAEDHIQRGGSTLLLGEGEILCWESFTNQYFKSTAETIRRAENALNQALLHGTEVGVSVNDFYKLVGLETTIMGEELGWNDQNLVKLTLSSHLTPEEKPALAISYDNPPMTKYWDVNWAG